MSTKKPFLSSHATDNIVDIERYRNASQSEFSGPLVLPNGHTISEEVLEDTVRAFGNEMRRQSRLGIPLELREI